MPSRFLGLRATTLIVGVGALHQPGRSPGQDPCHGSHPIVGGIIRTSYRSVFEWWVSYPLPPLCGAVSLMRRGTGMTSNRTKVTVVPFILVRSVWCACSWQSRRTKPRSISPRPALGVMMGERSCVFRVAKAGEGVMDNLGLDVGSACSS